jgi:hypothetical protein
VYRPNSKDRREGRPSYAVHADENRTNHDFSVITLLN